MGENKSEIEFFFGTFNCKKMRLKRNTNQIICFIIGLLSSGM